MVFSEEFHSDKVHLGIWKLFFSHISITFVLHILTLDQWTMLVHALIEAIVNEMFNL